MGEEWEEGERRWRRVSEGGRRWEWMGQGGISHILHVSQVSVILNVNDADINAHLTRISDTCVFRLFYIVYLLLPCYLVT